MFCVIAVEAGTYNLPRALFIASYWCRIVNSRDNSGSHTLDKVEMNAPRDGNLQIQKGLDPLRQCINPFNDDHARLGCSHIPVSDSLGLLEIIDGDLCRPSRLQVFDVLVQLLEVDDSWIIKIILHRT